MKRVYVAGKLNAMAADYIKNLHDMISMSIRLKKLGFAVHNPCLDILEGIMAGDFEYSNYFDSNYEWMTKADAVFVLPNSENSKGTQKELDRARELGIPIFDNLAALVMWGQR